MARGPRYAASILAAAALILGALPAASPLAFLRMATAPQSSTSAAAAPRRLITRDGESKPLHPGDASMVPLAETPVTLEGEPRFKALVSGGAGAGQHPPSDDPPTDPPPIDRRTRRPPRRRPADSPNQVKPPDTETLWDWYAEHGHMDADPSWAKVWPTASLLCGHICGTPEGRAAVRDRHVVDMGAGIGAVGIAAGLAGARSVAFLDREPYSLHCALSSSALNGLPVVAMGDAAAPPGACAAALYDWASPPPTLPIGNADPALGVVVLAADVLYDDGQVRMLARECKRILFQDEGLEEEGARRERVVLVETRCKSGALAADGRSWRSSASSAPRSSSGRSGRRVSEGATLGAATMRPS